ncbi:MAG: PilZ domain-containing protein [Bacillota bacterium]|nr:PilZ domain-containing protein [Bacillota bacterium]
MQIKPGYVVSLNYYSSMSPLSSLVTEVKDNLITLKLTKDFAAYNLFEDEPVTMGYEDEGSIYLSSCIITSINPGSRTVTVEADNFDVITDKRINQRFPVSLYAYMKSNSTSGNPILIVKNISVEGFKVISKDDIDIDNDFDMELSIGNTILPVRVKVIWKFQHDQNFEYGFKVISANFQTVNLLKQSIKILKDEYEANISKLKDI